MYEIIQVVETDSTNTLAKQYGFQGALHGTAVIAQNQTSGRGRLGKTWQSVEGKGLYCSVVLRPQIERDDFAKITLVAGLVVAEVIEKMTDLPVLLKWPNDIYINSKKCAGILCEASMGNGLVGDFIVVGIGVNLTLTPSDFGIELRNSSTSLLIEKSVNYSAIEIFEKIHTLLLRQIAEVETFGFPHIFQGWRERDMLVGKVARWVSVDGREVEGQALGINDEGMLFVRDTYGKLHEVLSGDVQLIETL